MGIIVKKGEYNNVNLKNLNPTHSVIVTVKGSRDITTSYGESTLLNLYVHRVVDAEGEVYEQVDVDAGLFINQKTKYTQELLEFLNDNVNNTVRIKLDRIEPRTYNIPNKTGGTSEKVVYTPVYITSLASSEPTGSVEQALEKKLPMPKGVFVQLAKSTGVPFEGEMNVQGKSYKVSEFVTRDEYDG